MLTACLIGLAGLFRDHTVPLILFSVGAMTSAAVVAWDRRSEVADAFHKLGQIRWKNRDKRKEEDVPNLPITPAPERGSQSSPAPSEPSKPQRPSIRVVKNLYTEGEGLKTAAEFQNIASGASVLFGGR